MDLQQISEIIGARRPTLQGAKGEYAVLVPLVQRPEGYHLLYEVRASTLRRQPGEVCFPGGSMEGGESPLDCALREAREELGIGPDGVRILGQLDFLLRGGSVVYPFLALISREIEEKIRVNPAEVSSFFTVSLSWLRENPPEYYRFSCRPSIDGFPYEAVQASPDYPWQPLETEVPVYRGLPHPLWGMTARVTAHLIRTLYGEKDS